MKYRRLGNTGLTVSETGFGTIPVLQGSVPVLPNYYNLSEKEALTVMEYAFFLGCNLYDTAIVPEYGDAERKLGKFAAHIGRNRIVITDKARFYDGNEMYQAVQTSCENLGTWADVYFVHQVDPDREDEVFGKGGALDALVERKQQRNIRFTGIASHYYDILLRGAADSRVDVLQGSGNILEQGMLNRINTEPLFGSKGLLINKVYAAGLLPSFFPVETLIGAVLSYPVSCALIGIGTTAQAKAAMRWRENFCGSIPTFEQVLTILEKHYSPIPCDRCQRCVCPYGTEIHTIFRQYQYSFMGKEFWALRKLNMGIAESIQLCQSCTQMPCLEMCPANIRIPEEMERVALHVRQRSKNTSSLVRPCKTAFS